MCDDIQTSEYRIYYSNVKLSTINTGVAFTSNRWDFVWEIKYWGLRTLNIIILTYFSIKWIKETYLWCVPVFYGVNSSMYSFYCLTPVTLFIIRSKGSTEKQPVVRTLSTRRRFAARKPIKSQIFSTRGKLLPSLHRSKSLKAKYLHACCWKWTFPQAMSKIPSFSRRLDTAPGHGRWLRGQISLDRGWLSQRRKPRNKRFLLLFRFYRFEVFCLLLS